MSWPPAKSGRLIIKTSNPSDALRIIPAAYRQHARITQLHKFKSKNIDQVLHDLDLPDVDDEALQQIGEQGMEGGLGERPVRASEIGAEDRGLVDRMLRRVRGQSLSDTADAAALDQVEGTPLPGRLSPEDILRLAGGPLPPEERQKCPRCGAVVSHSESKCPWCSAHLSGAEDR